MTKVTSCPEPGVLRALLCGQLPVDQVEPLAAHVETCTDCITALESLPEWVSLTPAPGEPGNATPVPLEAVKERLKQLAQTWPSASLRTPLLSSLETPLDLSFLEPAKSADELGWLGSFRILELLGQGGMGLVFRAEDTQLRRLVAIKVMRPLLAQRPLPRERFLREARAAAAIRHDHILTIYQVGEVNSMPYLAVELLPGQTLSARLEKGPRVSPQEVIRLGIQIASGLEAAHAVGLIHRDIKPANLWLEPNGRLKILDFGLVRVVEGDEQLTQSGTLIGTPAYMAPEQASDALIDPRADLFSLGVVLYEMATGRRPFGGSTTLAVLGGIVFRTPESPQKICAEVPRELSDLIMRLLEKEPGRRPASAQVVREALEKLSLPIIPVPAPRPIPRRWLVAAAVLLLAIPLAAFFAYSWNPPKSEPTVTKTETPLAIILDPEKIPASERIPELVKILVAVIGEGRMRMPRPVHDLAITPDGKFVIADSGERVAWELSTGKMLWMITDPERALSPDGKYRLRFGGKLPDDLKEKPVPLRWTKLQFTKDGSRVLGYFVAYQIGEGTHFQLSDVQGGQLKEREQFLNVKFGNAAMTADGKLVAVQRIEAKPLVTILDVTETPSKQRLTLPATVGKTFSLAFTADGRLITVGEDKVLRLWDVSTDKAKELSAVKLADVSEERPIQVAANGKWLAVGGQGPISICRIEKNELVSGPSIQPHGNPTSFLISPDDSTLITAARGVHRGEGIIQVWDMTTEKPTEKNPLNSQPHIGTGTTSANGKKLAVRNDSGHCVIWDCSGTEPKASVMPEGFENILPLAFTPDGAMFVTTEGTLCRLWKIEKGEFVRGKEFRTPAATVHAVFSDDGKQLTLVGGGTFSKYDVSGDPKEIVKRDYTYPAWSFMAISPDQKHLAYCAVSPTYDFYLLELGEKKLIEKHHVKGGGATPWTPAFSPDSKCVVAQVNLQLQCLDYSGDKVRQKWTYNGTFTVAAYLPDGNRMLVCEENGTLHLFDANKGESKDRWQLPTPAMKIFCASDGKHVVTLNRNGTVYVLRLKD